MTPQSSASPTVVTTARSVPAPPLKSELITGLAGLVGKVRQLVRFQPVTPFAQMSDSDRTELHQIALAIIHSQDPVRAAAALELAQQAAAGVLEEQGFVPSQAGLDLAKKMAHIAIVTHRLALEGFVDAGGVQ